ncbi:hypothetical protein [Sphingobacterium sp. LRF_L2]|uniref:hypothetical protein n=1 Tax=Sphingobacterium sp. LRF_L2 TaxID=3369421 RepID=UPI003F62D048
MKKIKYLFLVLLPLFFIVDVSAQETTLALNYKHKNIDATGNNAYAKALILLHPIYNGVDLANNYVVGHLVARRGGATGLNRLNTVFVNSSSAYRNIAATVSSFDDTRVDTPWKLKTCLYNGVKYMALDIPYSAAQHSLGFQFTGWATSSGESLKFVVYDVNGVAQNTSVLTDITDYVANMSNTQMVSNFNILGKVGIGTTTPKEELSVNGNIRAKEIKVETASWPDYVFEENYKLPSLKDTEVFIKENKHLPNIPSAKEVSENGVALGETNALLLQKIEELTLHLIEKDKEIKELQRQASQIDQLKKSIERLEKQLN